MNQRIASVNTTTAVKSACHHCSLSNLCLPISVSNSELDQLGNIVQNVNSLNRNELLFKQNGTALSFFAVRSGAIKTSTISRDGEEQVTGFFLPGEMIGLDCIHESGNYYSSSAQALERSSLCEIPIERLETLAQSLPELQHHLFYLMSREIQSRQQHIVLLSKKSAEERIAALLLSLSTRFERRKLSPTRFSLPMARNDIANFLGLAVETVSRVITRFQNQGLIRIQGREVELIDINTLRASTESCHQV